MKTAIFAISLFIVCSIANGTVSKNLLGAKECTWGPSYWCQNITNAAGCNAVKHCIQTVWEHKTLPPDNSSVCQTCLDMVKQARDQLLSNQTEEEIKEVFEGSCKLIPIEEIAKECIKVVDQFIPELVDTLASQMNPQVVCSVAGLCNNERFSRILVDYEKQAVAKVDRCKGCLRVLRFADQKFNKLGRDHVLQGMLQVCGRLGSLSDACSNIVLTYFVDIYNHLKENLNSNEFCLMSGECSAQFHQHTNIKVIPMSNYGIVDISEKDDLPCDLCEQLVRHLRDVIIANTTEEEFQKVLLGICKQTKSFKDECTSIVNEYYPEIYKFLSDEINSTVICGMIGICPGPGLIEADADDLSIVPLLPVKTVEKLQNEKRVAIPKGGSSVRVMNEHTELSPEMAQLPIERLIPQTLTMIGNTQLCTFCEYFLHYVQNAITDPKTEDMIKKVVDKACDHLPESINKTCREFVNTYGDAFVALLAQEIDPSVICPLLSVCKAEDVQDIDVFIKDKGNKPNCAMCLFAITELEEVIKENKTEAAIKKELEVLCSLLPVKLKDQCDDFVNMYSEHIVDAVLADLTPQEICVYLRLCSDNETSSKADASSNFQPPIIYGGEIMTNEIPDHTANGKTLITATVSSKSFFPECVICEFVISELEKVLKDNKTDEKIENAVKKVCTILPKTVSKECIDFIDKYGELVINLLQEGVAPRLVCGLMMLCNTEKDMLRNEVQNCAVCEGATMMMVQILQNPKIDHDANHVMDKACRAMPTPYQKKCRDVLRLYGNDLLLKIQASPTVSDVCKEVGLCSRLTKRDTLVGTNRCTWGPSYWCSSEEHARECGLLQHCQERYWGPGINPNQ